MNINLRVFFVASLISFQTIASPIQFEDTSDKLGFTRGTETWGISWGNLNMDEFPDLWNSGHRDLPRLYQNTGDGGFDDVAMVYDRAMNGLWLNNIGRDTHGGAWGDFDNDGDDDLVVGDDNDLYTNQASNGGNYFIKSDIRAPQQWAGWSNTDSDRALEIDTTCGTGTTSGQYMLMFDLDNDGDSERVCGRDSSFPDAVYGASSGLIPKINMSNDAAIGDFNNDLLTDIIVTRGSVRPNGASKIDSNSIEAWFRLGQPTEFTFSAQGEVIFLIDGGGTSASNLGPYKEATKIVLNTTGQTTASALEISISYSAQSGLWKLRYLGRNGVRPAYVRIRAQNPVSEPVMAGLGDSDKPQATYHGVNTASGIDWVFNTGLNQPRSCVSVVAADFDNDMDLDLYMACRNGVENLSNRYFDNNGNGSFTEVPSHGGEGPVGAGTEFGVAGSVVTADYDVDGFMDLAVSNGLLYYPYGFGGPDTLIRNKGNGNHWIELDLIGTISPRAAIGAKVYLTAGGITQLREQSAGYHRYSQNHSRIHFGLAGNTTVDEVRIVWPTGQENSFFNIAADSLYNVEENGNIIPADLTAPGSVTIEPGEECGQPPYNSRLGSVLQVWRNCGTDDWRIRINGGLGRLTEHKDLIGEGTIVGEPVKFRFANGSSTDSNDTVDNTTTNTVIDFKLTVSADNVNTKGINFNNAGQTSTCLSIGGTNNDFERAYIGSTGKRISLPFDLKTMSSCLSIIVDNKTVSEDAGFVEIQVNLAAASTTHITVDYQTVGNSATSGLDFGEVMDQLIFYPGETQKTIIIPIIQDFLFESDESFDVQFASGQMSSPDKVITVTIEDDETTDVIVSIADLRVNEGGGAVMTISLSEPISQNVVVSYATADVSATDGVDYTGRSGTIVFAPGDTVKTRTVTTLQDTLVEGDEQFTMTLSNPVNATLGQSIGTATITENVSTGVIVSIADLRVNEGGRAAMTISLSEPVNQNVVVNYATADVSATDGVDYTGRSGTIVFAPGDTIKTRTVTTLQDTLVEGDEQFTMTLSNPVNATLGQSTGTATIADSVSTGVIVSIADLRVNEGGRAVMTISLSEPISQNVVVGYATADVSATDGVDYTGRSGTIVFAPGDTIKTRTVTILQDTLVEGDEQFTMTLSNPVNATLGQSIGTATIADDDI